MKKIINLDFETGAVHVFDYDINIYAEKDADDFFIALKDDLGYTMNQTNCQWMIVDELNIEIH